MRRVALALVFAVALLGGCGGGDSAPTEEEVADALGADAAVVASDPGGQDTSVSGCQIEEIVIGEDQIKEYVSFQPDSMAVNDDRTAGVQMPDENALECKAQLEDLLNDI
jgi:hypothetical protein